jgi:Helix-turn-helix domain
MNNKDNNNLDLLTSKEAADELKVSESFLAKARMRGTGPAFIQLGRAVRYSRSALEAYKALQTRTSTSQPPMPAHPIARNHHSSKYSRRQRIS